MKFKFHFGHGIIITFILFAGMILNFVFKSFDVPINMVTKDYYQDDGAVNTRAKKISNTEPYLEEIDIALAEEKQLAVLSMPTQMTGAEGIVHFYRPSDEHQDVKYELVLNEKGHQVFQIKDLSKGHWVVILEWSKDELDYYTQNNIFIP
ncbi:FixH family protein [Sediminitomix flava]|uniref:FixH protein n=1 Tax=Sediminitomix flava TaxID=379075 RepID=A0A315Z8W8_SEDFL|nr:FixH family protein [Sediminitomix flava]PWJ41005.1 hypothetical protein BC781_104271 [Sediminitomix flava]